MIRRRASGTPGHAVLCVLNDRFAIIDAPQGAGFGEGAVGLE